MKFYNLWLSKNKSLTKRLREIIGFTPSNLYLYEMAFHHKSAGETNGKYKFNNERLEYLGDAVLSMVVGDYLFRKYPYKDEGFLTKMRSKIVKRKTLNDVSQKMGLDRILSDYAIGNISHSMAGNALEALIGAIYQDVGYEKSRKFIIKNILRNFIDMDDLENNDDNYKSQLLEWAQKMGKNVNFSMNEKDKLNGRDYYKIILSIDEKKICESEAYNKKSAEQKAAFIALKQLKIFEELKSD
ncbi:MAG: ribonuclease III [Deltaproteobacteria bacterium]